MSAVEAAQQDFEGAWADAIAFALRLAQDRSAIDFDLPDDFRIEPQWANPQTRSDKEDLETALIKKQLGISDYTLQLEIGYDPEKEAERRHAEQEATAEIEAKAFDAGTPLR